MSARRAETPQQALARARRHAGSAAAEAVAALRALLDAAALASGRRPAAEHPGLAPLARWLDDVNEALDPRDAPGAAALLDEVARALDGEIARWQSRAANDADARSVLHTLREVREILLELGARAGPASRLDANRDASARAHAPRRQRVKVE